MMEQSLKRRHITARQTPSRWGDPVGFEYMSTVMVEETAWGVKAMKGQ